MKSRKRHRVSVRTDPTLVCSLSCGDSAIQCVTASGVYVGITPHGHVDLISETCTGDTPHDCRMHTAVV